MKKGAEKLLKLLKAKIKRRRLRTLLLGSSCLFHIKKLSALGALVIPFKV